VQPHEETAQRAGLRLTADEHHRLLVLLEQINQTAIDATAGGLSMTTVLTLLRKIDTWSDEAEQILHHASHSTAALTTEP
jgi:hypothetical protein